MDALPRVQQAKGAAGTKGAAGPSGVDAFCWRRLCTSFRQASDDLCASLALVARRLCTDMVDPVGLTAFVACRLIALDKCPGVRLIGVGEVVRRIIGKAVLATVKMDIHLYLKQLALFNSVLVKMQAVKLQYMQCVLCLLRRIQRPYC